MAKEEKEEKGGMDFGERMAKLRKGKRGGKKHGKRGRRRHGRY